MNTKTTFNILDIPEPQTPDAIQIEPLATVEDLEELARQHPDSIALEETVGVGKHHGRTYLRAYIDAPVSLKGKIYNRASYGPLPRGSSTAPKPKIRNAQDIARELWEEVRSTCNYGDDEDVERAANRTLNALLATGYEGDDAHLLRVWLHFYGIIDATKNGRDVGRAARIYNNRLNVAVTKTFGISDWSELAEAI